MEYFNDAVEEAFEEKKLLLVLFAELQE